MIKHKWIFIILFLIIAGLWFFPNLTKAILLSVGESLKDITGAAISSIN